MIARRREVRQPSAKGNAFSTLRCIEAKRITHRILRADAGIALANLGEERSIGCDVGLPPGSTSYYCRRRKDLLALAFRRHAELDHRDIAAQADAHMGKPLSLDSVADVVAGQT